MKPWVKARELSRRMKSGSSPPSAWWPWPCGLPFDGDGRQALGRSLGDFVVIGHEQPVQGLLLEQEGLGGGQGVVKKSRQGHIHGKQDCPVAFIIGSFQGKGRGIGAGPGAAGALAAVVQAACELEAGDRDRDREAHAHVFGDGSRRFGGPAAVLAVGAADIEIARVFRLQGAGAGIEDFAVRLQKAVFGGRDMDPEARAAEPALA